mgnify:CR=1 FL=1
MEVIYGQHQVHSAVLQDDFRMMLTKDGDLFMNTPVEKLSPNHDFFKVDCFNNVPIVKFYTNGRTHAAITEEGKLYLWGVNRFGQCGIPASDEVQVATLCQSGALSDKDVFVVSVACGAGHTVVLTREGGVIVLGSNNYGQIGMGNEQPREMEIAAWLPSLGVRIVGCEVGSTYTVLVSEDGRVFVTGSNFCGHLGLGHTNEVNTVQEIEAKHFGYAPVAAVKCGQFHTLALTREGKVFSWGMSHYGAAGPDTENEITTPQLMTGPLANERVVRIGAGRWHSLALTDKGQVFGLGKGTIVPAGGEQGVPQLLHGELSERTVCKLNNCYWRDTPVFIIGKPPVEPGFDKNPKLIWHHRRMLLMCLLAVSKKERIEGEPRAAHGPAENNFGQRMSELPDVLWKRIIKFL